MSDWPITELEIHPIVMHTFGMETLMGQFWAARGVTLSAAVWSTANTAVFVPVVVSVPFLAQKMAIDVSVSSGNLDMGIYDEKGTRLVSKGSTAVGAAGLQVLDITDTWLEPGTYFIAMNCDNTTASFFQASSPAVGVTRPCGIVQQAVGAVALPSPATFAVLTARSIPGIAVTGVSVI